MRVLEYGAAKYGPDNWSKCESPERYLDAAFRHVMMCLQRHREGISTERNYYDPESNLHHAAHAIASLLFYLEILLRKTTADLILETCDMKTPPIGAEKEKEA